MYSNFPNNNYNVYNLPQQSQISHIPNSNLNNSQDRFIGGGFLGPFILGGITGGLVAPAFYNNRPYYYNTYPSYPNNYYYYGGYYR